MREIIVIGIGAGHPDQVTVQAVEAMNRAQVFFVVDKGTDKDGLLAVRQQILRRHMRDPDGYRVVEIVDPPRDRRAAEYAAAVQDWHQPRAERFAAAFAEHLDERTRVGAVLVWGDPGLYDSTLRVIDRILATGELDFEYSVIPGVSSVHALAAAHRIPLNRIGEPVHVTTGRRLEAGWPAGLDTVIVMLDSGFAAAALNEPDLEVFWGAYVGTEDEVLIAGRLGDVAAQVVSAKQRLRRRHGWIMDSYLLRRTVRNVDQPGNSAQSPHTARSAPGAIR